LLVGFAAVFLFTPLGIFTAPFRQMITLTCDLVGYSLCNKPNRAYRQCSVEYRSN